MDTDLDRAIEALKMDRSVFHPELSLTQVASAVFEQNLINAAAQIAHIAIHGTNERTRLDAAKYIVERHMGKIGEVSSGVGELEAMLKDVFVTDSHNQQKPGEVEE